jgi:undecaprenyl-diphosphatase
MTCFRAVSYFEAGVLGVVQGLTELLPISSSGHLRIVPALAGWEDPGAAFTAVVQVGTVLAVLVYFRVELWRIALTWTRSLWTPALRGTLDARLGWYIGLGTIPICIFGLAFQDAIEGPARNLWVVSTVLVVFAFVLLFADRTGKQKRGVEDLTLRDGLVIGTAQALALVPGVSRSGSTITAGLLLGLRREAAARYAFLLSTPAIVLSGGFELRKIGDENTYGWGPTVFATVLAFVVGYATIGWLLRFVSTRSYLPFVIYRVALGSTLLVLLSAGVISAT